MIDSTTIPGYLLRKRHNVLSFHRDREDVASGIVRMFHIDGKENPADILKNRSSREWYVLMKPIIFWVCHDGNDMIQNQRSEGSVPKKSALGSEALQA